MTSDLFDRRSLPEDLLFLAARYPREDWTAHANLGGMAQFWLQRHDMFRELGAALGGAITGYREGDFDARAFQGWLVPRLQVFLNELNGHHHIEDRHYFPVFRAAEPRLETGFAALEGDHELIHGAILGTAEAANALLVRIHAGAGDLRPECDRYADASDRLIAGVIRHLADEEDLIIPLILDRTEAGLGLA
jgi:hypothetical protein